MNSSKTDLQNKSIGWPFRCCNDGGLNAKSMVKSIVQEPKKTKWKR